MGKREVEGIIFKMDFQKTFDSVKWSFLFQVLAESVLVRNGHYG